MGLRATIASGVATAFTALGDVAETVTYRQRADGSYNATTGTVSHSDTDISVKAIVEPITGQQEANIIADEHSGDLSVLVKAADMTVTPDTGDQVIRNNLVHTVNQIIFDPAGATYKFMVGKQG